ncbi:MAG: nuclear transport factor 2 family protein [Thermomicrobiales bacterium]|nr:nuclear transport factor 2 family protein [Thermomicrobiales bacterium]
MNDAGDEQAPGAKSGAFEPPAGSVSALVRIFFSALDERDPDRMMQTLAPHAVFRALPHLPPIRTADEVVAYFGKVVSSYPGARWTVTDVLSEGDRASVQFVIREFSATQNREVHSEQVVIVRAAEGKIVSILGYYDTLEFRRLFWDEDI